MFPATRADALNRIAAFAPAAGKAYAAKRNLEHGPGQHRHVSRLSAALRRRLISEEEVIGATLAAHSLDYAEKFIAEVCWRTYWKGWLEHRPGVWRAYRASYAEALSACADDRSLGRRYDAATEGRTGIDAFDAWAQELLTTGYLHNWARMQFASIWLFTLRLPLALGIGHTARHFIDADPASNTLSWRWVAGAHTVGKTYLADAGRIADMTGGRLRAAGLAIQATDVDAPPSPAAGRLRKPQPILVDTPTIMVLTDDDYGLDTRPAVDPAIDWSRLDVRGVAAVPVDDSIGDSALAVAKMAQQDAGERAAASWAAPAISLSQDRWQDNIIDAAKTVNAKQIIIPYALTGPMHDAIADFTPKARAAGLSIGEVRRQWDAVAWPHCPKGFFALKQTIPELLRNAGLG